MPKSQLGVNFSGSPFLYADKQNISRAVDTVRHITDVHVKLITYAIPTFGKTVSKIARLTVYKSTQKQILTGLFLQINVYEMPPISSSADSFIIYGNLRRNSHFQVFASTVCLRSRS